MTSRVLVGAVRGSLFGLIGGFVLGAAGNVVAPPVEYERILVWSNKFGKRTRFTHLESASILKEDLLEVFKQRHYNIDALNEAFRNIQSAITLYHPVKAEQEAAEVMTATRMTNYVIRASKAMEAIHVEILVNDAVKASHFQKAMMNIQLSLEDMINFVRLKSKNVLPTM
ncbi:unnamed protein product [Sphacelaria rigidula]